MIILKAKNILTVFIFVLILLLVGCTKGEKEYPKYYLQMNELSEPVNIKYNILGDKCWVTYDYVLNPNTTMYYSPKVVTFDGNTYINEKEMYFTVTKGESIYSIDTFEELDSETLGLLFE